MTTSPGPHFLTPHGALPAMAIELAHPTVTRVNAVVLDKAAQTVTEMGIYATDRDLAKKIDNDVPGYGRALLAQQQFLAKAVKDAAGKKITQFVFLRAPLPLGPDETTPHTLATAHVASPSTVMVSREEIPAAHLRNALMTRRHLHGDTTQAAAVAAAVHDVHRPLHDLHEPQGWSLDLGEPVSLTMIGDPSHWPGDMTALIRAYHRELAVGSVVAVSALGPAPAGTQEASALEHLARYLRKTTEPQLTLRDPAEIQSWFDNDHWNLEYPGVAPASHWAEQPAGVQSPEEFAGAELPVWCAIVTKVAA
ncbi:hypothetical protein CFP71_28225 [Amycolatopsis thailandensis]|uniref:Uncharacterized protein n=1 Tax=Amycolatopsis thailandensis TaxID=589330 RepID=A0A229RV18_9PSEU|nr:SAM-dependent methyltransferase [Amycolatopsis thailandensis]OXM50319.1 hypothetical protein CFP71_28225 [Amycolatopsis thailandensis]